MNGLVRMGVWIVGVGLTTAMAGFAWVMQPVELPLAAVLVLTFTPLGTLNKLLRERLQK